MFLYKRIFQRNDNITEAISNSKKIKLSTMAIGIISYSADLILNFWDCYGCYYWIITFILPSKHLFFFRILLGLLTVTGVSGSSSGSSYSVQIKQDIDDAIASNTFVMFSASYCPYSRKAKESLKPWQPFTVVEVDLIGNSSTVNQYKSYLSEVTGAYKITWPRVFIAGKCVGGLDDIAELKQSGELQELIEDARRQRLVRDLHVSEGEVQAEMDGEEVRRVLHDMFA